MSFSLFKTNMLSYMRNQKGIEKYQDFSTKFIQEYDSLIKRGQQSFNFVRIDVGGVDLAEVNTNISCQSALSVTEGPHTFLDDVGNAILAYWQSAQLSLTSPPSIPATGAILNLQLTGAIITNPGVITPPGPLQPTDDSEIFVDKLVNMIRSHLFTIEGIYFTLSLYPTFPPTPPAPGVLNFKGWTIPDSGGGSSAPPIRELGLFAQLIEKIKDIFTQDDTMSEEQIEAAKVEVAEAEVVVNDKSLPAVGRASAREYIGLKNSEISSGKLNALPVKLTDEELQAIEDATPDEYKCEIGTKIVAIAKRDIGILETGTPPGLNYGGFPGGVQKNERGRIDDMFDNVGLDNQAKVKSSGSGYYWCAAAVSTWWQEAGLKTPSGGASCDSWMTWAKNNGKWSTKPKIGAAVLYGSASDAHHIGIVAGVTPAGIVTTIEGNTSGGGFSRNGCGVFQKVPKKYLGFVLPDGCE